MPDTSILDLTTDDFVNYENQIITLLREARPELDLRVGTALRDVLVRSAAQIAGAIGEDISDLRAEMSFKRLSENPELATDDAVESLASNYGIVRRDGVNASGYVAIYFQRDEEMIIPADYRIGRSGFEYGTTQVWKVRRSPSASDEVALYTTIDGVPFSIVPFSAILPGSGGNVKAGESFELIDNAITLVDSVVSYSDVSGGKDQETVEELLARIGESISHTELTSSNAITTRLKNEFPSVQSVSLAGFGDPEQLRDKHNVFGVAVGSRVDAWVKTYTELVRETLLKSATKVSDGVYSFTITPDEVGVIYKVAGVASPDAVYAGGEGPIIGSYPFTEERSVYGSSGISHDVSGDDALAIVETAYTKWQSTTVTVTDVAAQSEGESYPDSVELRVDVYVAPRVDAIQNYLDDLDNRNREADILVRGAVPAFVSLSIPVYRRSSSTLDLDAMRIAVTDYVNSKDFGDDLTISQLSAILHGYDIVKIGTDDQDLVMRADVRAADGSQLSLVGTELKISEIADSSVQVTENTTIFVADLSDVYIVEKVI